MLDLKHGRIQKFFSVSRVVFHGHYCVVFSRSVRKVGKVPSKPQMRVIIIKIINKSISDSINSTEGTAYPTELESIVPFIWGYILNIFAGQHGEFL